MPAARPDDPALAALFAAVAPRLDDELSLRDLCAAAGLPSSTLIRRFQQQYGLPPMQWLWELRTLAAAELIRRQPTWSFLAVALACGFGSSAHFSRRFREVVGCTPSRYRERVRRAGASARDEAAPLPQHEPLSEDERLAAAHAAHLQLRRRQETAARG